jgi:hypothetical protein
MKHTITLILALFIFNPANAQLFDPQMQQGALGEFRAESELKSYDMMVRNARFSYIPSMGELQMFIDLRAVHPRAEGRPDQSLNGTPPDSMTLQFIGMIRKEDLVPNNANLILSMRPLPGEIHYRGLRIGVVAMYSLGASMRSSNRQMGRTNLFLNMQMEFNPPPDELWDLSGRRFAARSVRLNFIDAPVNEHE